MAETVNSAVKETGSSAEVEKVEDINQIMTYGVMMTPALVIDGDVKVTGRVPDINETKNLIQN